MLLLDASGTPSGKLYWWRPSILLRESIMSNDTIITDNQSATYIKLNVGKNLLGQNKGSKEFQNGTKLSTITRMVQNVYGIIAVGEIEALWIPAFRG